MNFKTSIHLIILFFISIRSFALSGGAVCDSIFRTNKIGCDRSESANTIGGSFPLLFDAFNFSPSALPTFESPIGIEAYYNSNKLNVAFLKGFDGLGFGFSSKQSTATFFSGVENYKVSLANANGNFKSNVIGEYLNLGTAFSTLKIPDLFSIPIGISYRYNPDIKKWTPVPGIEIRTPFLSLGLSYYAEKMDKYSDSFYDLETADKVTSFNASSKLGNLILGYSLIQDSYSGNYYTLNTNSLIAVNNYVVRTNIFSFTYILDNFSVTGALREQSSTNLLSAYSSTGYKTSHYLIGGVYKTDNLEFGTYYNYILNNDFSAILKLYF